jgi:hypothetical protein
MTRYFFQALCLALCCGCGDKVTFPDCEALVMTTPSGDIDECDLLACEAAFGDGCIEPCVVNQPMPPQYIDDDGRAWTVYDFCPDWGLDTGGVD